MAAESIDRRLATADALVWAGCYDCLTEALALYKQSADADARAKQGVTQAMGLLAIRERELGLADSRRLEQAREGDDDPSDAILFDVIETLPWRLAGPSAASDAQLAAMMRARRNRDAWRAALSDRTDGSPLSIVTSIAYTCAFGGSSDDLQELVNKTGDSAQTPLVQFTVATCRGLDSKRLSSLMASDPRLVEVNFFLGLGAAAKDLDDADRRLQVALGWQPDWPAALIAVGDVAVRAEDFDRAVDFYERTLAVVPANADVQLRLLHALSYAGRYQPALTVAGQLLANGRWYRGDAFYWQAWNEAQLNDNEAAWTAVHEAAKLIENADVPKLIGILAIRRGELSVASGQLQQARTRNPSDCHTQVLLGGVHLELREWVSAASPLADALTCLEAHDADLRKQITELRSIRGRERAVVRREQEIEADRQLRAQSWFNLAVSAFNRGNTAEARDYAERVVDDDHFGTRARDLLVRIKP